MERGKRWEIQVGEEEKKNKQNNKEDYSHILKMTEKKGRKEKQFK